MEGGGVGVKIKKTIVGQLPMSYAVSWLNCDGSIKGIAASEGNADCFIFDLDDFENKEVVWQEAGGTMSISQVKQDGSFLAVQNFYKGFNAKTACIVKALPIGDKQWRVEKYLDLPYVHRFEVVEVGDEQFILAATLCDEKEFKEDWRKPGRVWFGKIPESLDEPCELKTLITGITKNHGYYQGVYNQQRVVLISGQEGLYEIKIPKEADGEWEYQQLISEKEISDATILDIDHDGEDEIITIEGFHGDRVVVNKKIEGEWKEVYSYPVKFGHVVWGGNILGSNCLVVGYRQENAALILMKKSEQEGFYMDQIVIDEHEAPTNISVLNSESTCKILCSCGGTQRVVLYELTK